MKDNLEKVRLLARDLRKRFTWPDFDRHRRY